MEKKTNIFVKFGYVCVSFVLIISLIGNALMGFRWPSNFVMTQHILTDRFGYIQKAFVGTIFGTVFGDIYYTKKFLYILILGISILFLVYVIYCILNLVMFRKNALALFVLGFFAISPYARYYLHEAGYFEQYGFLFSFILLEVAIKKSPRMTCVLGGVGSMLVLLISKTNAFLVVPTLCSIVAIKLFVEIKDIKKIIGYLVVTFSPSVLYCALIGKYRPTKMTADLVKEYSIEHVHDFDLRMDLFDYIWNPAMQDVWDRSFKAIPIQWIILPLILVFLVSFFLWKKDKVLTIVYAALCIVTGLFNYSIVLMAWDLNRYYFCIFIQVFLISLFVVKVFLRDVVISKDEMIFMGILFLAMIGYCQFEFALFDGAQYLRTIDDFVKMIHSY